MTQIEEMLIARACPIMTIYRKHGGQRGYRGHVLNLPQNIEHFVPILLVKRQGADNTEAQFRVRREKILNALLWLRANNTFYQDIDIDHDRIHTLPEDGIPLGIQQMEEDSCESSETAEEGPPIVTDEPTVADDTVLESTSDKSELSNTNSFLPKPEEVQTEEDGIRRSVAGCDPLNWPELGERGINEYSTEGLATQVFPTLFPFGKGDPTTQQRHHAISRSDGFKHLIRYSDKSPNGTSRWRFASHPRFPYWALNMKHRHQLLSQSKIYLQRNPSDANLTIEQLQDMVGRMDYTNLIKRLQRYASKIQGSRQYWYSRYEDLKALLHQKGSPTFFWTVSSADNYWPQLHSLMPSNSTNHATRVNSVINNPHLTDWYFYARLSDFIRHWLQDELGAEWYWYRYEYQARGSTHAHGCAKLKNDPGLTTLVSRAALGWMEEKLTQAQDNTDAIPHNHHIIQYGIHAKQLVVDYIDSLVTTINNSIPDETWRRPEPHPCAQKLNDIVVTSHNDDYHSLVNCVQRHTKCSSAYCLRKKNTQSEPTCRFGYPLECSSVTILKFDQITTGELRATITTARNDPRVNTHNKVMLQNWRANVDFQIIVDVTACARYLAKYVAKSEPRSKAASEIYTNCVSNISPSSATPTTTTIRKCMIQSVGERDFSVQETAHLLLSLPLYSCTYNFVTVSLDGSCQVQTDRSAQDKATEPSTLDVYAHRSTHATDFPTTASLNLIQFVSKYSFYSNKAPRCKASVIHKN